MRGTIGIDARKYVSHRFFVTPQLPYHFHFQDKCSGGFGQGFQYVLALFAGGGDDGAQGGEALGALHGAETAGYFHSHLHHAQGLLGQIVGEGHLQIMSKAQHIRLEIAQTAQKIMARAAFFARSLFHYGKRRQ